MLGICKHSLELSNVSNNEHFCYSLIILNGLIKCPDDTKCSIAENVTVSYLNNDGVVIKKTIWTVREEKFKILIQLKSGKNNFIFKYCNFELTSSYVYSKLRTDYKVMPLYVIFDHHNGLFQAPKNYDNSIKNACKKIIVGAKLIQTFFAEKLNDCGYGRKTFNLKIDPSLMIFRSKLLIENAYRMKQNEIWEFLGREIMTSKISSDKCKFLAFLSCTFWDGKRTLGRVAIGGGGLALFGTPFLFTWPSTFDEVFDSFTNDLDIDELIWTDNKLDNKQRDTYGGCFGTTLGAVCHELGHSFDLGHCNDGIMGHDFDVRSHFIICDKNPDYTVPEESRAFLTKFYSDEFKNESLFINDRMLNYDCATFLNYHKWFQNRVPFISENSLKFDHIRGIISSNASIIIVQLRNENGGVLRTWRFAENVQKHIFLISACEMRKADMIVIEDSNGQIVKRTTNKFS